MAIFPVPPPEFPWKPNSRHNAVVWYALMTVENGKIQYESHASSGIGIHNLLERLRLLRERKDAVLFGVWTGQYTTNLFAIDIPTAIARLESM